MKRTPIDLTDKEMEEVYRALFLSLNERNSYWNIGRTRVFNHLLNKLNFSSCDRKYGKRIMSNFYNFKDED